MQGNIEEEKSSLPPSRFPYRFMPFRTHWIAVNHEHGTYIYDDQEWKLCMPQSNNPLTYDTRWYHRA